jgi:hypothetical protein
VFAADCVWDLYRQHPDSCYAMARASGATRHTRVAYLKWLQGLLAEMRLRKTPLWTAVDSELRKMRPVGMLQSRADQVRRVTALVRRGDFGRLVHRLFGRKAS